MRLLVVSTAYPLPEKDGFDVLVGGLLRELHPRHEILLAAITDDDDDLARQHEVCSALVAVRPRAGRWGRVHQELVTLPTRRPVLAEQATEVLSGPVARAVRDFKPDLMHLMQSWTAELVRYAPGVPTVLSALDASGPNWEERILQRSTTSGRYLARRELARMLRYERTVYPQVGRVVLVTEEDSALVRAQSPQSQVGTITNGIDADFWERPERAVRESGLVVFTGAMSYPPNVSAALFAAEAVLPRLRDRVPGARLRLVGRDPAPQVRMCAGPFVDVTGTVPDVRPHLWEASAYLCPMTGGSGVKNKLLEALAAGCPSVATSRSTLGLGVEDGKHLLVRNSPEELANGLAQVLGDPAIAEQLSRRGAQRGRELSWAAAARDYERTYQAVRACL